MVDSNSVDHVFENSVPEVQALYQNLLIALEKIGEVRAVPKQTSIHLEKNSGFAGVHPRKNYFNLEFRTDYQINHPRITREQKLSARRFEYTVKIEREADIDDQLLVWLKDAYALSK